MIKAILFDAYGTLFDVYSVEEKCEKLYKGKGSEISLIWRRKQLEYTWLGSLMKKYKNFWDVTKDALKYTLNLLNLEYDDRVIDEIMKEYLSLKVYDDVPKTLKALKGIKMGILSNGNPEMLKPLVDKSVVREDLDLIISVDDLKIYKPTKAVYEQGVNILNLKKEEILFVSANYWDVAGSKNFGYKVAWLNRLGATPDMLDIEPDYILKGLNDILLLVDK